MTLRNFDFLKYLVYHTTASSEQATVNGVVRYWRNELGWTWGGYNLIVDRAGIPWFYVVEGRNYRYDTDPIYFKDCFKYIVNGVHGFNWCSIHIGWIGGRGGIDNRTMAQKETMYIYSKKIFDLFPKITPLGHRDLSKDLDGNGIITPDEWSKDCPSMDTIAWLNQTGLYNYLLSKQK